MAPRVADRPRSESEGNLSTVAHRPASLVGELRVVPELGLFATTAALTAYLSPVGPPRPVLVLPGFVTGDTATLPLRAFLRSIGHRPRGWRLGINVGPEHHIAEGIDRSLIEMAEEFGGPVDVVGISAGGIYARILAGYRSELVRQVVSLGSPIRMEMDRTNIEGLRRGMGRWFAATPDRIDLDRVPVPSTTVWTRTDGVVPGDSCRQTTGPTAEAIEVRGSHTGMGHNPAVLYLIADRLALPTNQWVPFEPPRALAWCYPTVEHA